MPAEGVESTWIGAVDTLLGSRDQREADRAASVRTEPRNAEPAVNTQTCPVCSALVGAVSRVHFARPEDERACEGSWSQGKKGVSK